MIFKLEIGVVRLQHNTTIAENGNTQMRVLTVCTPVRERGAGPVELVEEEQAEECRTGGGEQLSECERKMVAKVSKTRTQ
jgi:hypothetical protein